MENRNRFNQNRNTKPRVKEDFAIVIDIKKDNQRSFNSNEIIQAIGFDTYTLFELVAKQGAEVKSGQKVYIGDGKRDEIQYIKRVLFTKNLTPSAESELPFIIMDIIDEKEEMFVQFFNNAGPISLRRHSLELIPGIGKKNLKHIFDLREEKQFESFKDIKERCSFIQDPVKSISTRIYKEVMGETEHKFFVKG